MAFKKLSTPSLKEVFTNEIENMILSGELNIGDKLPPEREIVESMGISLSVVTAGITELESKGFVEIRPRQGVFVSDYVHKGSLDTLVSLMRYNNGKLNRREVLSLIETRISLERLMVSQVIERGDSSAIAALERYLDIIKSQTDFETVANTVLDFFHEMSIQSDNLLLPLLYHSFRAPMVGMYVRYMEKSGITPVYDTTQTLFELVCAHDAQRADAFVEEYLRRVIDGDTAIC